MLCSFYVVDIGLQPRNLYKWCTGSVTKTTRGECNWSCTFKIWFNVWKRKQCKYMMEQWQVEVWSRLSTPVTTLGQWKGNLSNFPKFNECSLDDLNHYKNNHWRMERGCDIRSKFTWSRVDGCARRYCSPNICTSSHSTILFAKPVSVTHGKHSCSTYSVCRTGSMRGIIYETGKQYDRTTWENWYYIHNICFTKASIMFTCMKTLRVQNRTGMSHFH